MIYNPNMQKMMTTRPRCKENDKIGIVEINPDLVAQIDQKLLSQILKLITEKGARARYVKEARRSGVRLLRLLIATAAETTTSFGADPRLVRNLRRLRELKDRSLVAVSQVEFDTLRYSLERANESLPPNHRDNTHTQMQSHMLLVEDIFLKRLAASICS